MVNYQNLPRKPIVFKRIVLTEAPQCGMKRTKGGQNKKHTWDPQPSVSKKRAKKATQLQYRPFVNERKSIQSAE